MKLILVLVLTFIAIDVVLSEVEYESYSAVEERELSPANEAVDGQAQRAQNKPGASDPSKKPNKKPHKKPGKKKPAKKPVKKPTPDKSPENVEWGERRTGAHKRRPGRGGHRKPNKGGKKPGKKPKQNSNADSIQD